MNDVIVVSGVKDVFEKWMITTMFMTRSSQNSCHLLMDKQRRWAYIYVCQNWKIKFDDCMIKFVAVFQNVYTK